MTRIKVVAWDFDGVLTRNVVDGRFIWADDFEADIGHSRAIFDDYVFGRDLEALLSGKEDLRDRVEGWAKLVGYEPGADALLEYWFTKDANLDPEMQNLMARVAHRGIRQVITTNNEARRTAYLEDKLKLGDLVEHVFASGRLGVAKPNSKYFEAVSTTLDTEPAEIFFVDDCPINIEAAKEFGWQVMHFTDDTRGDLETLLLGPIAQALK